MSNKEWGNITWKLFHSLAAQIKEDKFDEVKNELINIIIKTCKNLPCPFCSEHASNKVLKRAYTQNIKTKLHFIEFLRQLHNIVNLKLQKKTYSMEEINAMYVTENLGTIIPEFFRIYSIQYHNMRLMTNSMHRKIFLKELINDLNSIKYAF
jgi:hypothetical protein